jgi:ASC-1-like (ASCH) protein
MKKILVRFRAINRDTFTAIRRGVKTVETRAATVKYRNIQVGDVLVFVCGKDRFEKKIQRVRFFKSIIGLFRAIPIHKVLPKAMSLADAQKIYFSFPGYKEKIKKSGLVALELVTPS